ncbi:hypothetical protein [Candidatus Marithrix sp. Canyon 246]|uniref:hypothetical protein n=1 Tax=Candidatus Marithrix sp. Canyon 246 TaxID=1827136 RepID=UPI000849F1FC|nr:hypothetical protein [Candidatus Marithrix sp. Canyon 246]
MIEKQKVAESFDRAALTYDQWITIQKNIGDNLLERVEWLDIEPEHILEVGTGTGRLTRALTEQYKDANVNSFIDMHHYGNSLLQAGLKNPVMDIDRVPWQYKQVKELMIELKNIGAHNINSERSRGLMGKHKFQAMIAAYEKYRLKDGLLPVTYEVIYGHALGKQIVTDTNVIHFHPEYNHAN